MKAVRFLLGFAGVTVLVLFGIQLLPALEAGNFDVHEYRTQVLGAGLGAVLALFCFSRAMGGKKEEMNG
jgi:hypothetical protein